MKKTDKNISGTGLTVIVDCGSTNSRWCVLSNDGIFEIFELRGFNPYVSSPEAFIREIEAKIISVKIQEQVQKIIFYGSGVNSQSTREIIRSILRKPFGLIPIQLHDDMLGACRATSPGVEGLVCILGTGSNSCHFDGKAIKDRIPSLGFILSDEGSGTHLGINLLRAFFNRSMPQELRDQLATEMNMDVSDILNRIYRSPQPNTYIASFSKFIKENQHHPFFQGLIKSSFGSFLTNIVMKYNNFASLPVHFVGSIAYHFRDELVAVLLEKGLRPGLILRDPMPGLIDFHQKEQLNEQ